MFKSISFLLGWTTLIGVVSMPLLTQAQTNPSDPAPVAPAAAQTNQRTSFDGRGVAQGAAFTRGRNADVSLSLTRSNFIFDMREPRNARTRVQYRGSVVRQNQKGGPNSNSFVLDGRVQTFDSSDNQRILNNTTGTCRIEVFDGRVISSTCRSATSNSTTQFLGLEQF